MYEIVLVKALSRTGPGWEIKVLQNKTLVARRMYVYKREAASMITALNAALVGGREIDLVTWVKQNEV